MEDSRNLSALPQHACTCAHMYMHTHAHTSLHTHTYKRAHVHAPPHAHTHTQTRTHTRTHTDTHTCMHAHAGTHPPSNTFQSPLSVSWSCTSKHHLNARPPLALPEWPSFAWVIHMWDMMHLYAGHASIIYGTGFSHMWDMTYSMWNVTHSYVVYDTVICGIWIIQMWDTTQLYRGHDSFVHGTWRLHLWNTPHSYAGHGPFICGTWRILWLHLTLGCDTTPPRYSTTSRDSFVTLKGVPKPLFSLDFCDSPWVSCDPTSSWSVPWRLLETVSRDSSSSPIMTKSVTC